MYWHGYPASFDEYLSLKLTDRLLANDALSEMISRTNEAGATRPKDER